MYTSNPLSFGEVDAIKLAEILHKTLTHSVGKVSTRSLHEYVVVLIRTGSSILKVVCRSAAPVRNSLLNEGELVGFLHPGTECIKFFFVSVARFSRFTAPPVTNNNVHTTKVINVAVSVLKYGVRANVLLRSVSRSYLVLLVIRRRISRCFGRLLVISCRSLSRLIFTVSVATTYKTDRHSGKYGSS